jgi:hypothetical protein
MRDAKVRTYDASIAKAHAKSVLAGVPDKFYVLAAPIPSRVPENQWRLVVASASEAEVVSVRELMSR